MVLLAAVGAGAVWFLFGQGGESALARADVQAIGQEVEAQYAATDADPFVAFGDNMYAVGSATLATSVTGQSLVFYPGADSFCVVLTTLDGATYSYSAATGLADGSCAPTGASPTPVPSGDVDSTVDSSEYWFGLAVGDCIVTFDAVSEAGTARGPLTQPTVVPCTEQHRGEVYAIGRFSAEAAPDDATLRRHTWTVCEGQPFAAYVGGPFLDSSLTYGVLYPTAVAWASGADEFVCIIVGEGGDVLGSARNSEAVLVE